jgi:acyl-CoA thioesterase
MVTAELRTIRGNRCLTSVVSYFIANCFSCFTLRTAV